MSTPNSKGKEKKKQVSVYLGTKVTADLDAWIRAQSKQGYEVDRSHVVNVLLKRFLEKNAPRVRAVA